MTDHNAAKIVDDLRTNAEVYELMGVQDTANYRRQLATLIEQQAKQLAEGNKNMAALSRVSRDAQAQRDKAESEVAALRKVIEDAPHGYNCPMRYRPISGTLCDCWKSKVLPEKETL